jgi:hypothetical protein
MYAQHKCMPGDLVYTMFKTKGVLDMLDEDYDVLHGFGFEYVVNDIDKFLATKGVSPS